MSIESWINPDEVADFAAHASAMVDAALVGTDLSRDAFWSAVRKGYNTPYNDPPRRKVVAAPVAVALDEQAPVSFDGEAPPVVSPALAAAELHAV